MTAGTPCPIWRTNRRRMMTIGAEAAGAGNAVLLAACGATAPGATTGGSAPRPSTQPVTVRMNVRSGGDEELWKFFAPKLKEKLPNVTYQVEGIPGDFSTFLQKVTVLAASNQLGDVIYSTT